MAVPSRNVAYKKPEEPSFLKAFKSKVGYREPATVDTKRKVPQAPQGGEEEEEEREDELPTVVVLREGDVSQEEYQQLRRKEDGSVSTAGKESHTEDDDSTAASGDKIVFRKPVKRRSSEGEGALDASTSKKAKAEGPGKPRARRTSTSKAVKNSSLLSFGDEEEEASIPVQSGAWERGYSPSPPCVYTVKWV